MKACGRAGKHPRVWAGVKEASGNAATIAAWWKKWPTANIGLSTGNGLVVIDIDGPAGESSVRDLDLPPTVEVTTGRGRHLYYVGATKTRIKMRPGLDIKATDDGYVVAPPSLHASGAIYTRIDNGIEDLAPLPAWVTDLRPITATVPDTGDAIVEGERNTSLFRYACLVRSVGASAAEVDAFLQVRNRERCSPPLLSNEVAAIAASASDRTAGLHLSDSEILDLGLTPKAIAIYLAIRDRADHQGVAIVGYDTLVDLSQVSRSTVLKAGVPELEQAGLIEKTPPGPFNPSKPQANTYTLLPLTN